MNKTRTLVDECWSLAFAHSVSLYSVSEQSIYSTIQFAYEYHIFPEAKAQSHVCRLENFEDECVLPDLPCFLDS